MNYIERSIVKNYEQWLNTHKDIDDMECSKKDITACVKYLEHKALRACMVKKYYQRAMVKIIKEIKKSTEEGSLFAPLIEHAFDSKIMNQCEKGTQTRISVTNGAVESPEHFQDSLKTQQTNNTLTTDNNQGNSNIITQKPCTADKCDKDKGNTDLEDLIYILTTSPNFPKNNDNEKTPSPKNKKYEEESIKDINFDNEDDHNDSDHEKTNRETLDERLKKFATLFDIDESNITSEELENTNKPLAINALNNTTEDASPTYDSDSMSSEDDPPSPSKLILDWKSEYAAQNCNLKSILAHLDPFKKDNVQKKFKVLFDIDEPMDLNISLKEASLSRKRTANLVVEILTPYYSRGRIASRNVFKTLAKKITDDILLITNIADIEEVTDKVSAYFKNGKCINAEKDIMDSDK
ncbi:uncharacterized protein [Halyomorpha halys]|uniref:uncharacterized protein n=1 Tax=Halyomorpha halys TaxID=286706 RepID=UPI0034D1F678